MHPTFLGTTWLFPSCSFSSPWLRYRSLVVHLELFLGSCFCSGCCCRCCCLFFFARFFFLAVVWQRHMAKKGAFFLLSPKNSYENVAVGIATYTLSEKLLENIYSGKRKIFPSSIHWYIMIKTSPLLSLSLFHVVTPPGHHRSIGCKGERRGKNICLPYP